MEKINYLSVYSRWGDAIFDVRTPGLNDPAQGWDGTFRSKKVMPGVYVFACEVKMLDGTTKVYSGDILVVE